MITRNKTRCLIKHADVLSGNKVRCLNSGNFSAPGKVFISFKFSLSLRYAQERKHLFKQLKQAKCKVIEKNYTGYERREMSNSSRFEVLHVAWPEPQRRLGALLLLFVLMLMYCLQMCRIQHRIKAYRPSTSCVCGFCFNF